MSTKIVSLVQEVLTHESFSPYGRIISKPQTPAKLAFDEVESWLLPFEVGSAAQLMLNRFHKGSGLFSVLERHRTVTQCFLPLGGIPFIMVVAVSSNHNSDQIPKPEDLRAFLVKGAEGLLLWRGTWHSIARFPVGAPYIDMGFLTDTNSQHEIEHYKEKGKIPKLTDFLDLEKKYKTVMRIENYN